MIILNNYIIWIVPVEHKTDAKKRLPDDMFLIYIPCMFIKNKHTIQITGQSQTDHINFHQGKEASWLEINHTL